MYLALGGARAPITMPLAPWQNIIGYKPHRKEKQNADNAILRDPVACRGGPRHRRRCFAPAAWAVDISGAGATFPYPIYAKWADTYKKETGVGLNYQSIGSGGGIKQIEAKTVTFGATDAPLKGEDLDKSGLVQFPMVMGGIVPVVNFDGIEAGRARARRADARQDLPWPDQDLGRRGDQEAQSQRQAAVAGDRRRSPLRRFRHHLQFHLLPLAGQPGLEIEGRLRHRRSNGRSASAPRAMKASPTTSPRPRARSATSNTPMPCRTS